MKIGYVIRNKENKKFYSQNESPVIFQSREEANKKAQELKLFDYELIQVPQLEETDMKGKKDGVL